MHAPEITCLENCPGFPGETPGKAPLLPNPLKRGLEPPLLDDFGDGAGAYRAATLADGKT